MDHIFLSAALAFLITFFAIPIIIQVARDKKLFDEPDERKVHKVVIPTLGGLGIFAGFILATLIGAPTGGRELQFVAAATIVIFFLGIKDDILVLSAAKKFLGQIIAAGIIIWFGKLQITDMHGIFGIHGLPQTASLALTFFTALVIINSFNLIDGVDGLAGSLGLLTTLVFGTYFFFAGEGMYAVMAFALSGSIIAFLIYNFSPAKIFMGDTGSLLLGLVNAVLVIKFIGVAGNPASAIPLHASPAIGFAILIVPLFDTLRVFGLRILDRRSPFSPDRTHVHHFLLDMGLNHKKITFVCIGVNIGFILLAFFLRDLGTTTVLGIVLLSALAMIGLIYYLRSKNNLLQASAKLKREESILKPRKLFTLASEAVEAD
ncbi:undecaprenyl/decaprenyl-phosphate alpha-N-acetylglucosaminyl 1-phosphate transferase [Ferruginibacter lapsinanis]|uniref:glycosyltransferase family 4 protein n=1 Tax=Ferruginibacter lapsinanis TaxID=563172 RepID=UPI001E5AA8BF|nr:MraY family glycosyltransferase [Ferruginibacter lapsinanis]UEG50405.1 undecaprenyl/decaprenyl-phosphate alpha-N-acetylglucosaminyl 1-phosphate transferase [Ferruginibacter lapsinanis]